MHLLWGVVPVPVEEADYQQPRDLARRLSRELGLASEGHHVLIVSGFRPGSPDHAPAQAPCDRSSICHSLLRKAHLTWLQAQRGPLRELPPIRSPQAHARPQ